MSEPGAAARARRRTRARRWVVVVLVAYLALVARITLSPAPASDTTFDVVREVIRWLRRHGVPVTWAGTEAVSNVLMFVPFGVLVGLLVRRWWLVVLLACAVSTFIELDQLWFLPSRVPTVQDVVLNTLGAATGVALLRAAQHKKGRALPQEDPALPGAVSRRASGSARARSRAGTAR